MSHKEKNKKIYILSILLILLNILDAIELFYEGNIAKAILYFSIAIGWFALLVSFYRKTKNELE
jgi:hypothetical protein